MNDKMPPLTGEALDGERYEAPIPRDIPLPKKCTHKGKVKLISSTEIRCACGSGWSGPNINQLYELLK